MIDAAGPETSRFVVIESSKSDVWRIFSACIRHGASVRLAVRLQTVKFNMAVSSWQKLA